MFKLQSVGHYMHGIGDEDSLPDLKLPLKAVCQQNFRRIDRFIQLAMLGAGRCCQHEALTEDIAIYIGSGIGPVSNNIVVQEQIQQKHLPKPFNFVNTLGSSTGYYVTRSLGLPILVQNQFVSRRHYTLQSLLALAASDMQLGLFKQVLVGVIEECSLPLADHRLRQDIKDARQLAEGSHWFLFSLADCESTGMQLSFSRFSHQKPMFEALADQWKDDDRYALGSCVSSSFSDQLRTKIPGALAIDIKLPFHDSLDAALLSAFVSREFGGRLHLVSGDDENGWYLICCG